MTFKQQILKYLYPVIRLIGTYWGEKAKVLVNIKQKAPAKSIFDLKFETISGAQQTLSEYKGKKILFVNTASDCGYTGQYAELEKLHHRYKSKLAIIAFPSNDYHQQENYDDSTIAAFCQTNYNLTFPLSRKVSVKKNEDQHPIYQWLTDAKLNGWNNHVPDWNFSKFLVDERGILTHYLGPAVAPFSKKMREAIESV